MNPLFIIARFELAYQIRQPTFYLFAALIFGQGIWYTAHLADLYSFPEPVATSYLVLSSLGVVLAAIAVLVAGQSLTKDIDYRTTACFFTLPITSRMHFTGRFIGSYATTLLLAAFYPLGILAFHLFYSTGSPALWIALTDGFIQLVAPDILTISSLTFLLTVLLRSIRGAYVSLFIVIFYFLLTESSLNTVAESDLWQLLDPFGVGMARESVENSFVNSESSELITLSDMFFINRMLWFGLTLGILAYAESKFSFDYFTSNVLGSPAEHKNLTQHQAFVSRPISSHSYTGSWQTGLTIKDLTRLKFLNLTRQPIFKITLSLLVVLTIWVATAWGQNPDFPELPTTSRMTALRLPMGLFIGIFLLVMTTESLFLERTTGLWPIYDTVPQPTFVLLVPKLLALTGIAAILTFVLFLTGVSIQISSGFEEIDWERYVVDLLIDGFLRYCQLIALGAFVAALVNDRLLSHLFSLLIFALLVFIYQFSDPGQSMYAYSFLPGSAVYSDLTGYATQTSLRLLMHLAWWGVAGIFTASFLLIWNRGVVVSLSGRFSQWRTEFRWPYALAFLLFSVLLGFSVWQIRQQSMVIQADPSIPYSTRTLAVPSASGGFTTVRVRYHHPYQIQHIVQAANVALRKGEQLFGAYPYSTLHITETPAGNADVLSKPGEIMISEKQGWIADNRRPDKLDYVDYLISREVFKQWLVHTLQRKPQPGNGLIKQSLAEYLALQSVSTAYGPERLQQRLSQRAAWYARSRQRSTEPEPTLLQSNGNDAVERGRAALVLASIGQVWGDKPLSFTIGQFYKKAVQQPISATANAFVNELIQQLPDSLHYLQTYFSNQLWFDFKLGRVANLSNGLTVEISAAKWRETKSGDRQALPINDYIPLVVLDQSGRQVYRQLVHPNPDESFVSLPILPQARKVVIDPLGAWPEATKRDNTKLF